MTRPTARSLVTTTLLAATLVMTTAACSSTDETPAAPKKSSSTPAPTTSSASPTDVPSASSAPSTDPAETPSAAAGSGEWVAASWANPVTAPGELLGSVELSNGILVDYYQVTTTAALEDGSWIDPDSKEPILKAGDPLVWFNWVVTNASEQPLQAGTLMANVDARYDSWEWGQGMSGEPKSSVMKELGINNDAIATGAITDWDKIVLVLGPGESYSLGTSYHYMPGDTLNVSAVFTPVDDEGTMLHDQRVEGKGAFIVK